MGPWAAWRDSAAIGTHVPADRRTKYGTKPSAGQFHLRAQTISGRTFFRGPKTEQSLVHLIIFHLPHAPTRLPGHCFD
jgi:hypothetical protein